MRAGRPARPPKSPRALARTSPALALAGFEGAGARTAEADPLAHPDSPAAPEEAHEAPAGRQTPPRPPRQVPSAVAQHAQEGLPVARQLRGPDAGDGEQPGLVGRPLGGHAREDGVAEDDVGGNALGVGELAAQRAQALEERAVGAGKREAWGGRGWGWCTGYLRGPDEVDEGRAAALVTGRAAGRDRVVEVGDEVLVAAPGGVRHLVHGPRLAPRLEPYL